MSPYKAPEVPWNNNEEKREYERASSKYIESVNHNRPSYISQADIRFYAHTEGYAAIHNLRSKKEREVINKCERSLLSIVDILSMLDKDTLDATYLFLKLMRKN